GDYFTRSLHDLVYILEARELQSLGRISHSTWIGEKIFLPRQDQLQKMINTDWFDSFRGLLWFYQVSSMKNIHSMEQLWLAFVMMEKYKKVWNDEDWRTPK